MELSHILRTLFRRKLGLILAVAVGTVFAVLSTHRLSLSPLALTERTIHLGAANTQMLIDSPQSSLVDIEQDTVPLATRAAVYAQFMRSNVVRTSIAAKVGVPVDQLVAEGPFTTLDGRQNITRPSEVRSNEIRGERDEYRLVFDHQTDLPIVSVYSQAPSPDEALALADASVAALQEYVADDEVHQGVPVERRTVVRELGPAQGGWVNNGTSPMLMGMAFLAGLLLTCFVIVLLDPWLTRVKATRRRNRELRKAAKAEPDFAFDPRADELPAPVGVAAYLDDE